MSYTVIRSHEICAGHRVVGHESKCRHLHGHNYKFHFKVAPKKGFQEINSNLLDDVGRVIDFSVVKTTLCQWLEDNWDHKFLHWNRDNLIDALKIAASRPSCPLEHEDHEHFLSSLVSLPFNPTAENLAAYMVNVIGPQLLDEHGVQLVECTIEETSKCHVNYSL
ncbi:6-carboxy-5,6,7,8-tetrahydropterin synthase [Enterobacteria phage 9g] [Escherichia phage slur01]|uniref:QueD-like 6-pyruvoyl-tetrahydropterin synthase n=1 Tax=Escherichia phage slur01 TaxID=1720493 RepID=UPI0006C93B77|nr:QueD-like 6-pyruvoyl-tetrahydropterin synthase [Escherichia phage slur01]CUL01116.1 6-carboxy-5,6,7,8-tetrahydropterin synthase [Enterobacteria phage 9g] [Escherichia phage slur01]